MHDLEGLLEAIDERQARCTQCGECLDACATYLQSGWELESPRGRIRLAQEFIQGRVGPESSLLTTYDNCLGCQACEPVCPVNLPYGELHGLVQEVRETLRPGCTMKPSVCDRNLRSPWRRQIFRRSLGRKLVGQPSPGSYLFRQGSRRPEGGVLWVSCAMDLAAHDVIETALNLASRLGVSLGLKKLQGCGSGLEAQPDTWTLEPDCAPPGSELLMDRLLPQLRGLGRRPPDRPFYFSEACGEETQWTRGIEGLRPLPHSSACCGARGQADTAKALIEWRCGLLPENAVVITASARCLLAYRRWGHREAWHPLQWWAHAIKR